MQTQQQHSDDPSITPPKKKLKKHWEVRQNGQEATKLNMLAEELDNSVELKRVSHPQDIEEFEATTNREFNRNFETALMSNGAFEPKPVMRSRRTRDAFKTLAQFQVDETAIKNFSFRTRYAKNMKHGRNTSTISNTHRGFFPRISRAANGSV